MRFAEIGNASPKYESPAEEGTVALAHHDRHQVDRFLAEQPEVSALTGDRASGERHDLVAGNLLRPRDGGFHALEMKVNRALGVRIHPAATAPKQLSTMRVHGVEHGDVELEEVARLYTQHELWDAALA